MYGYFIPTVNLMSAGCASDVGKQAKIIGGSRALVVTDKPLVKIGIVEKITTLLNKAGIKTVVYDDVMPNPTDVNVHSGVDLYQKEDCDIIIAVGGGSPIDCAKGIGLVATNGGSIKDYEGLDMSKNAMPPFIAVNTTAGTASEMTRLTIITNTDTHVKMTIVDWHVTPTVSINDPELMGENTEGLSVIEAADLAMESIKRLSEDVGIPSGLKELGVKEEDLSILAENALKDACGLTNPRIATKENIIQIYKNA